MKKTSIRFRLMIMVILLATLPVVFTTVIATNNIRDFSTNESINASKARISWGASYLEELIAQLDRMFYSLQINEDLRESIENLDDPSMAVRYLSQNYASDTLATAYYANSRKIDELIYYTHDLQKTFAVSYKVIGDIKNIEAPSNYWKRLNTTESNIYFEPHESYIYAVHSLNRFHDQSMYGGLAVKIREDVWQDVLSILEPVGDEKVFVINDEEQMVAGTGDTKSLEGLFDYLQKEDSHVDSELDFTRSVQHVTLNDHFYFLQFVDEGKLMLIKSVPISQVRAGEINTIRAAVLIMALAIGVAVVLSIFFSLRISNPIVQLARTMRSADLEGLEVSGEQSIDEIDLLEDGYNQMVVRLKELIQEEYQHEIELKNAQLLALQAQINPHFLNNTLNLVGGMALDKDAPEIYDMARSISDLLRYSVKDSDELVSLQDELNHVGNYLKIQQKRYEGRCEISYKIDASVQDVLVPKFILQPIIENAFEYGLQPKPGDWLLTIHVFQVGRCVGIVVKDNGVGMTVERLKELRARIAHGDMQPGLTSARDNRGKEGTGIGLRNVALRLKLRFKKASGIRVFSQLNNGTMVLLTIALDERSSQNV